MVRPRLDLQAMLESLSAATVYFQPPNGTKMSYPCIVYKLDDMNVQYADNQPHLVANRYEVTVIDRDPDSVIKEQMTYLPYCSFAQFFTADDLNHFVFNMYF